MIYESGPTFINLKSVKLEEECHHAQQTRRSRKNLSGPILPHPVIHPNLHQTQSTGTREEHGDRLVKFYPDIIDVITQPGMWCKVKGQFSEIRNMRKSIS